MIRARPFARAWLVSLAFVTGCSPAIDPGDIPAPTPGLELSDDDYPTARARFRTRLIREGPSTPDARRPEPPTGSVEVAYRSGELTLRAFASPPDPSKVSRPAVLFLHGSFDFDPARWEMTRPFREAGYVVMVPLLRGENGQAGSFSLFYDEVEDVLAAANALAARADVDPKRLYVAGHSVGGTLTLLASLASPRFRAAASFSGSPDQVQFTRGRPDRVPFDPGRREEFRLRSPVAFATHFRCPVRMYHGEEEYWLQDATRRTALLAAQAGLDVESVEVSGGHDTARPEVIKACIAFFRDN